MRLLIFRGLSKFRFTDSKKKVQRKGKKAADSVESETRRKTGLVFFRVFPTKLMIISTNYLDREYLFLSSCFYLFLSSYMAYANFYPTVWCGPSRVRQNKEFKVGLENEDACNRTRIKSTQVRTYGRTCLRSRGNDVKQ